MLVNSTVENIGARRLQTVMERVLDEISFEASDRNGDSVTIDAAYVTGRIGELAKNADLSKFILSFDAAFGIQERGPACDLLLVADGLAARRRAG